MRYGLVFQGARYEGLVTVFTEYLGAYGGKILDGGRVTVASPAGVAALTEMRDEIYGSRSFRRSALTWHEEEARFAFQNGDAAFMRNWPYAYALHERQRLVAGRRPIRRGADARRPGGRPTAALGGAQLAINALQPRIPRRRGR